MRTGVDGPLKPPRLRPGSRVALIAPAGPVTAERVERAVAQCAALGVEGIVGEAALGRHGYLAGPDAARARDFAWALGDPDIDAVWALRGGYGTMRLLGTLDLPALRARPRPFIGFSDNTAMHLAFARAGVVSYHAPHAGGPFPAFTEACFRSVLFEPRPAGVLPIPAGAPAPCGIVSGCVEGRIAGGNLALLAAACGTPVALDTRGAILFLEDVGESNYRIDRTLTQLLLASALEGVAGIAFGRFTEPLPSDADLPLEDVLADFAARVGVPCVHGVPVGHVDDSWSLPLGVLARLDADAGSVEILEAAVS
ncbi:MAG: S66 peptidase family protein [Longimicrobiales bacterium]